MLRAWDGREANDARLSQTAATPCPDPADRLEAVRGEVENDKIYIHIAQQRAALAVNRELVLLYWQIGRDIMERRGREGWGAKVIERLAQDLRTAFQARAIVQQAVGLLPWGHNLVLLSKLKIPDLRLT